MLNLRLARSPLKDCENEAILNNYNRLTSSRIPMREFLHWVQSSPEAPAWHAILETDEGEIVGHTSVIPLRGQCNGRRLVAGLSEYTFIHEEFRAAKIRGHEKMARPKNTILIDRLFRHCAAEGWGPFLISTFPGLHRLGPTVGCYPADFPLTECLLILRPWNAARETPNLRSWQRILFWLVGVFQSLVWWLARFFFPHSAAIRSVAMDNSPLPPADSSLFLFGDQESLRWRFPDGQYVRLALGAVDREYVIFKRGSADRFVRMCQFRMGSGQPTFSLIATLAKVAKEQGALGLRWAVYGNDESAIALIRRLRRFGFLCVPRVRTLLISAKEREFLAADKWTLTDAIFSLDP